MAPVGNRQPRSRLLRSLTVGSAWGGSIGVEHVYFATPEPTAGHLIERLPSPDGRWELRNYETSQGGVLGVVSGHAELLSRNPSKPLRTVYAGSSASFAWRGSDQLLAVEYQSGIRHAIAVPNGSYNSATHGTLALTWGLSIAVLPAAFIVGMGLVVALLVGRRSSVPTRPGATLQRGGQREVNP